MLTIYFRAHGLEPEHRQIVGVLPEGVDLVALVINAFLNPVECAAKSFILSEIRSHRLRAEECAAVKLIVLEPVVVRSRINADSFGRAVNAANGHERGKKRPLFRMRNFVKKHGCVVGERRGRRLFARFRWRSSLFNFLPAHKPQPRPAMETGRGRPEEVSPGLVTYVNKPLARYL